MAIPDDSELLEFATAAEWEAWLAAHHQHDGGAWLKIAKKGSGKTTVTLDEAIDVALCYGWIDSQGRGYDERYYLQRYSRRRPKGSWSKINVERVARLTAAGRMREPGLAEVRAAQADGRWGAAYESQKSAEMPPDLAAALKKNAKARRAFERLDRGSQYQVYLPLLKATTPKVRAARLAKAIEKLVAESVSVRRPRKRA